MSPSSVKAAAIAFGSCEFHAITNAPQRLRTSAASSTPPWARCDHAKPATSASARLAQTIVESLFMSCSSE